MSLNNFQNVEAAAGRAIPEFPRKLRCLKASWR
jgi:hypothetical protein